MLELKSISKSFHQHKLFENYSLTIKENDFAAIVGESGCGKTTLLNIMGSIERIDQGEVWVDGNNVTTLRPKEQLNYLRYTVSFMTQNYALMDDKTVEDNIKIGKKYSQDAITIEQALNFVGMAGTNKRIINTLSGGEQQRIALARILLKPSKIILADEPTGNLDKDNAEIVWNLLKELSKTKTVIVVTHDTENLERFNKVVRL